MGLGPGWTCLFANDFDHKKSRSYRQHWGDDVLRTADVASLKASDLPGHSDLVWASFPCQDLSLAGAGAGLKGDRSGTFWPFWERMKVLIEEDRAPGIVVLENVTGALTSHGGKDFATICGALNKAGYRCGTVVIDAALFVPQSRARLFVIAVRDDLNCPQELVGSGPVQAWHPQGLRTAYATLSAPLRKNWIWWAIPTPPLRKTNFANLLEENPSSVRWHSRTETRQLLSMMSDLNLAKVEVAKKMGRRMVGAIYKRTRLDKNGCKVQRAEIRFDNLAGCLRTPAGGSSRQLIMVVDGQSVRSRLISSRETARLMGLPDEYELPERYNEAYHLTGDGVVVPVVRHLAKHILEPILVHRARRRSQAA